MCVCVCVCFGIYVLNTFHVERWFWEFKMLFGSLIELHVWLHSCLCFSLVEKLFFKQSQHLSTPSLSIELFSFFLSQSRYLLIARSIYQATFCPLNSSSTAPQSIELLFAVDTYSIAISIDPLKLDTSWHLSIYRELLSFYI